jgi:proteasome activator subunit 4
MLSEFLPKYSADSVSNATEAQGYLVLFLPVEYRAQHTIHADAYLPTIFSLWSMLTYSSNYDTQFAYIVSRIAENHLDQGTEEIGLFTKQQIKSVFTTGLRMMNLPVGTRSDGSNSVGGAAGGTTTGYGSQGHRVDSKAGNAAFLRKKPVKRFFFLYIITLDVLTICS